MPEQEHGRHGEQAVDGAGDAGKFGARVVGLRERDSEEKIGFDRCAVAFAFALEKELLVAVRGGADFLISELEQEIHGLPVVNERVFRIERFVFGEGFGEGFGGVGFENDALLALVAERFKECGGGVGQWLCRRNLKRVADGVFAFEVRSWRFDDEPSDEIKVGGFPRLLLLIGNHEVAAGLQAGGDAFLKGPGDGIHGGGEQLVVEAHVRAVVASRCRTTGRVVRRPPPCRSRAAGRFPGFALGCANEKRTVPSFRT